MGTYYYSARSKQGSLVTSSIEAGDLREARQQVIARGLIPIKLSNTPSSDPIASLRAKLSKIFLETVSTEDFMIFNRQFQAIYAVGIPLMQGLELMQKQTQNPYFKTVIGGVITDVRNGRSLETAMSRYPKVFESSYTNLIRVGEASGKLDSVLEKLVMHLEESMENRERIKAATFYPKMVIGVLVMVFFIVFYWVMPKIAGFYNNNQLTLPVITQVFMGISKWVAKYWYGPPLIMAALWGLWRYLLGLEAVKLFIDKTVLRLPVLGTLMSQLESSNFCSVLELLASAGVPIVDALALTRDSLYNRIFKAETQLLLNAVAGGGSLSNAILKSTVFPAIVANLVAVGEEAGRLEVALGKLSNYFKMQVRYRLTNLSKILEPVLLFIIAGAVLMLALAVFLPLWGMNAAVRR